MIPACVVWHKDQMARWWCDDPLFVAHGRNPAEGLKNGRRKVCRKHPNSGCYGGRARAMIMTRSKSLTSLINYDLWALPTYPPDVLFVPNGRQTKATWGLAFSSARHFWQAAESAKIGNGYVFDGRTELGCQDWCGRAVHGAPSNLACRENSGKRCRRILANSTCLVIVHHFIVTPSVTPILPLYSSIVSQLWHPRAARRP